MEAVARFRGGSIADRVRAIRDQTREGTGELGGDRRARSAALFGDRFHKHRVLELAPAYWKLALERDDIRMRLDRDPFRSAEIALAADG